MSWLSNLFGGNSNAPMDAANPYLNQIPGVGHENYDPYVNAGRDASDKTKSKYEELMNDPTGFINKLMEGYKTSEGYNFQKDQLTKELGNTAAAGGVAGTPMDQMNQAQGIQGLLGKDMQQFLQNALGVFGKGLEGEEGIAGRGFDASKALTDLLGNNLANKAGLAYKNEVDKNQRSTDLWNMFGKALGAGAGSFFGPLGTAAGTALGNKWFGGK
jgi:hypothetical protein